MLLLFSDSKGNTISSIEVKPTIKGIKIGSSEKCDVCLKINGISPEHLLISTNSLGKLFVQDLQSNFGTYIGKKKLMPGFIVEIDNNTKIQLSDNIFLEVKTDTYSDDLLHSDFETSIFPFFLYKNQQLLKNAFKEAYSGIPQVYHGVLKKLDDTISAKIIELTSIIEVSYTLNSIISFQRLLEYNVDMALKVTNANRGFIMLYNEEADKLETVVARGLAIKEIEQDLSSISLLVQKCFNSGKQIYINNLQAPQPEFSDISSSLLKNNITSVALVPLKVETITIGVLYLDTKLIEKQASTHIPANPIILEQTLEALKFFAAHASIAINKARLFYMATTDNLTGLVNQKHFYQRLLEEYYRAIRHQKPLSVVALDIDNFKLINKRYGSHVGDQVLIRIGRMFKSLTRVHDLLSRYDSDMYMLLLPETPLEGAKKVAEKLKQILDTNQIKVSKRNISISGSFGVVSIDPSNQPLSKPNEIIVEVEKAVTQAKKEGGNKIVIKTIVKKSSNPSSKSKINKL